MTIETEALVKIKFRADFRGLWTSENYYTAGQVAALSPEAADALIDQGVAVAVPADTPVDTPAESAEQTRYQLDRPRRPARPPAPPRPVFHRFDAERDGPLAKLRFTRDFRGGSTANDWFTRGSVGEFPVANVKSILAEGVAELAPEDAAVDGPSEIFTEGPRPTPAPPSADFARLEKLDALLDRAPALLDRLADFLAAVEK